MEESRWFEVAFVAVGPWFKLFWHYGGFQRALSESRFLRSKNCRVAQLPECQKILWPPQRQLQTTGSLGNCVIFAQDQIEYGNPPEIGGLVERKVSEN